MKFLVVLAVAVACAAAAEGPRLDRPTGADYAAPILKSSYDISSDGNSFQYEYETGNGISAQAQGAVKDPNSEYPTLKMSGGYRYTAPDGTVVDTSYVADEEGFKPQGSHLPVGPPIPEAILRSLAWIAENKPYVEPSKPFVEPSKPSYYKP